jgi:heptosyltransferase-2
MAARSRGRRREPEQPPSVTRRLTVTRSARFARPGDRDDTDATPKSVLVRMPNWVGDACLALPFLTELRRALPDATLVALARPGADGVAKLAPVDEVILLEDRGPLWVRPWRLRHAGAKLRVRRFDAAVSLPTTTSSALLLRMAGIANTVGYGRGAARFLFSRVLDWKKAKELHRAAQYLNLLAGLGLPVPPLAFAPPAIADAARQIAAARLAPVAAAPVKIGFGVGSMAQSRRWPAEQWAELAKLLTGELGAAVVLLGGPGDRMIAEEIQSKLEKKALSLVGLTQVEEMPAVMAALDAVVSNDSGSAHLAAVAGAPTVVFFGAGDPKITAPLNDRARVLTHPVDCAPCLSNKCRFALECLTGISAARVLGEVKAILAERGAK